MKSNDKKPQSLLDKKLADPAFRKRFETGYAAFELEVQILKALEKKKWTYQNLAKASGTSKSNISRDLSKGAIRKASLERINRIVQALGYGFIPLLVPLNREHQLLGRLQKWGYLSK
ncbi:MAG: hypothetical protein HY401_07335 [Elusimicrobia bacterium]|nr:hypothetical protein [Elusimicrobiota bacterium]